FSAFLQRLLACDVGQIHIGQALKGIRQCEVIICSSCLSHACATAVALGAGVVIIVMQSAHCAGPDSCTFTWVCTLLF
uniref:Uncharacterized protein n=1 Tax=Crocodylus porosus TaxID=8502 RepID=A0A7M4FW98_CROPO